MKLNNAQDAIRQAIEGGYIPPIGERSAEAWIAIIITDPFFWQALGKARGWLKRNDAWAAYDKWNKGDEWKYYAHFCLKTRLSNGDETAFWQNLP